MMADETNNKLRAKRGKTTNFLLSKTFECMIFAFFIACMMLFLLEIKSAAVLKYIGIACIFLYCTFNVLVTKKYKIFRYDKRVFLWLTIFAISIIFSGIFNSEVVVSLERAGSILSLFILSIYLLPCMLSDLRTDTLMSVISNTIFIVLAICALLFNDTFAISYDPRRVGAMKRFLAGFSYPSCLGYYCFLGLISSLYPILFKKRPRKTAVFSLVKIALFVVLIFTSDTRTTMLIICVFLAIFFYLVRSQKKASTRVAVTYLVAISLIVLIILLASGVLTFERVDLLLSYRLTLWGKAIATVMDGGSFLFGTGIYMDDITSPDFIQIDNGFVKTFYQYGFISLILLCVLLARIFIAIKKNKSHEAIFGRALFLAFVIYCVSESNFYVWVLLPVIVYCISGRFIDAGVAKKQIGIKHNGE